MSATVQRLLLGTDEPVAPALALQAGRLQAYLRGTRLGPITFDGREVWHGVDFLFRDADWGTPGCVVERLEQDESADRWRLRGHIDCGARLDFEISIEAGERVLRYEVRATASADLATNRTGLVLMHPLAACACAIQVEHTDGRSSASTFPVLVAPWPPFMLVRAVRHEYADGAWAACRFEGDDFELEDQRNNADASFKTYSRSNLMPRPYVLRAGAVLQQAVELRIEAPPARPTPAARGTVRVRVGDIAGALPAVGTAITAADVHAPQAVRAALHELAPAMLHLGLELPDEGLDATGLARLLEAAGGCGLRLDIAGITAADADAQLGRIAVALRDAGAVPGAVAVFPSTPPLLEAVRRVFPRSAVGGGTPHFFTQLNRIEDLGRTDFLCFTTASVVHGADDEEIMAGLQSLPAMIQTLRLRHGLLPVRVGPSSIGARRSPLGAQPASDGTRRLALARRDPRTRGLYGAAWTLGYVARFAHAGVEAITLHALQGDAALVGPDGTTPAFEVLRRLGTPARWRSVVVSAPHALAALALDRAGGSETLLGNLLGEPIEVALEGTPWPTQVRVMDASSLRRRASDPLAPPWRTVIPVQGMLRLEPYAIVSV